jgi:hypothetical protein
MGGYLTTLRQTAAGKMVSRSISRLHILVPMRLSAFQMSPSSSHPHLYPPS